MLLLNNINKIFRQCSIKFQCIRNMSVQSDLREIFSAAVDSVKPENLIKSAVKVNNNNLYVREEKYTLKKPCYVVGFGKAVLDMALQLEAILGPNLAGGVVNIPTGILNTFPQKMPLVVGSKLKFIEGAPNNLPDEAARDGAQQIKDLAAGLKEDDLLIVLISGGGSALLPLPKRPVTLFEKCELTRLLQSKGADIVELNCVRKRISELKGGGLALTAFPAQVVTLILSDVIGDPLDYIASGPTTLNTDAPDAALRIIEKYSLQNTVPESVTKLLQTDSAAKGIASSCPKSFGHVRNLVIGNNRLAAEAAEAKAKRLGYDSALLSVSISDEVSNISRAYAELSKEIGSRIFNEDSYWKDVGIGVSVKSSMQAFCAAVLNISESAWKRVRSLNFNNDKGICLILAGEPTVVVRGRGRGGRNQQLALNFAVDLYGMDASHDKSYDIYFMSAGTDGIDGPTDAAGAISYSGLVNDALKMKLDPVRSLRHNDSYNFFAEFDSGSNLIRTGHTGTNVMDVHAIIVKPHRQKLHSKL